MKKSSSIRFRPGSRLPEHLGVSEDAIGTVICTYLISHPSVASPERIDVRFEGNRMAWGVPRAEFELVEHGGRVAAAVRTGRDIDESGRQETEWPDARFPAHKADNVFPKS